MYPREERRDPLLQQALVQLKEASNSNKKRSKDSFISSSMSFIDELDIGDGETPKNDYIRGSAWLMPDN